LEVIIRYSVTIWVLDGAPTEHYIRVVTIAFVETMVYIEVKYGKGFFPVGRKPIHNRVRYSLLREEVNRAYFQPRVYYI